GLCLDGNRGRQGASNRVLQERRSPSSGAEQKSAVRERDRPLAPRKRRKGAEMTEECAVPLWAGQAGSVGQQTVLFAHDCARAQNRYRDEAARRGQRLLTRRRRRTSC